MLTFLSVRRVAAGAAVAILIGAIVVFLRLRDVSVPANGVSEPTVLPNLTAATPPSAEAGHTPSSGIVASPLISSMPSGGNVPPYTGEPVIALAADPAVIAKVPAATYEGSTRELEGLADILAKTPGDIESWMRVAHIRHFYHDYAGARDAYEYLNIIADGLTVPFYNLGVLYGYYLNEPAKAAAKFEAAIARDPVNESFYTGFADFEREVLKNYAAAEATLKRGLARVPGEVNFFIALASLYRDTGRIAEAIDYYRRALATSALGEGERAAISAEIDRLEAKAR